MAGIDHTNGVFSNLWGTMKAIFHLGGPDNAAIAIDPNRADLVMTRVASEDAYAIHEAKRLGTHTDPGPNALTTYLDVSSKYVNILGAFDGASPPSSTRKGYYLCNITGGSYTENDIVYHDGTAAPGGNHEVYKTAGSIEQADGDYADDKGRLTMHITTTSAIVLTGQTLIADAVYAWEYKSSVYKWVLKGFAGAGDDNKLIRFRVQETGGDSSSTATVPVDHFVTRVLVNVVTQFHSATTLNIKIGSNTIMADADMYIHLIGNYEKTDPYVESTGDVVTADLGGSLLGTGDAYVIVEFGKIYT